MRPPAETPGFSSDDVTLVRPRGLLVGLAGSPLLLTAWALWKGATGASPVVVVALQTAIVAGFALSFVVRRKPWPVRESVRVTVGARTIEIGDRTVAIDSLTGGFVLPGWRPRVELRRRFAPSIELELPSLAEARSLLRAIGLDASQTTATFRAASRATARRRYVAGLVGGFFGLYGLVAATLVRGARHAALGALSGSLFAIALLALVAVFLMPTRVVVGADGLVLRWFGVDRFIGWGEVEDVERYDKGWGRSRQIGVRLALRSGEEVLVPMGQSTWGEADVEALGERIREALEGFRDGDPIAEGALLRRAGRPVEAWLVALRSLGAGANADLRTAPVPRERLFRIVESPTAPAADRAAAAAAIAGALDQDARDRLRRAAEASAAPRLRVALEAAADGGRDAELGEALAELEAAAVEADRGARA